MTTDRSQYQSLHDALREFEQTVKKHEHIGFVNSEVAARQNVDRARQAVVETVRVMIEEKAVR